MFCVVSFPEENKVAVVPQKWIYGDSCYWPSYSEQRLIDRAIKSVEKCNKRSWQKCGVRILNSYPSYDLAKQHLSVAEMTSDLSDGELVRNYKRKSKTVPAESSSDSSETDEPPPKQRVEEDVVDPVLPPPPETVSIYDQPIVFERIETDDSESITFALHSQGGSFGQYDNSIESESIPYGSPTSTPTTSNQGDERFKSFLVRSITRINKRLDSVEAKLDAALNVAKEPREVSMESGILLPNMPISTVKDLQDFDEQLRMDDACMRKLISVFSKIGGSSLAESTSRILYRLFTPSVASEFSFKGQKGKLEFYNLMVNKAVTNTLLKKMMPGVDERQIEIQISNFLKQAPLRVKRQRSKSAEDRK